MKNFTRKFKKSIMLFFKLALFCSAVGIYVGGFKLFFEVPRLMFKDNYVLGAVYLLILLILSRSYHAFDIGVLRLRELIYSFFLALAISDAVGYAQISLMRHIFVRLPEMQLIFLVQAIASLIIYAAANAFYFWVNPPRNALAILADPEDDTRLLEKFLKENKRYNIVASCNESEGFEAIKKAMDAESLVIMFSHGSHELRSQIIRYCYEADKRLLMVPNVDEVFVHDAKSCQIDDVPALLFRNRRMTHEERLFKRLTDIILSSLAIVVLSPVMLITALLVHAYDKGPALFRQTRVTEGGRQFELLKFRSMILNAEAHGAELASRNDARITPIGRWIRMLRIDELPQLLNILKGDMSIVGPRPERPELIEEYCRKYPEFRYRLKVKAGLTGYAQVFGRYNTVFEDKLKLDLLYIQKYSLLFDFYIMLCTIKILFMPSSSEGV